jgi:hypothetical protein
MCNVVTSLIHHPDPCDSVVIPHTTHITFVVFFNDLRKQLAQNQWLMMVNDGYCWLLLVVKLSFIDGPK